MAPLATLRPTLLLGNPSDYLNQDEGEIRFDQYSLSHDAHGDNALSPPWCCQRTQCSPRLIRIRSSGKRVSFSELTDVHVISNVTAMSTEEMVATWWTQDDYTLIRRMLKITVLMFANGGQIHPDDQDFCARGLRYRTKTDAEHRHRSKKSAINAVLRAQDYQQKECFRDPDYIKLCYLGHVKASCAEARQLGIADELESKRIWMSA